LVASDDDRRLGVLRAAVIIQADLLYGRIEQQRAEIAACEQIREQRESRAAAGGGREIVEDHYGKFVRAVELHEHGRDLEFQIDLAAHVHQLIRKTLFDLREKSSEIL